jgi:hypothetical protein
MADIAEFLAARIAEDWSTARDAELLAGLDGSRGTREAASKRAIVAEHALGQPEWLACCRICYEVPGGDEDHSGRAPYPCPTLRAIAAIWEDHPEYDQAWKPAAGS